MSPTPQAQSDMPHKNLQFLELEHRAATATTWVWLNRPTVRNAFSDAVIAELTAAFTQLGNDTNVRSIVLAARGVAFCAGADLGWMRRMADYSLTENEADAMGLATMLHTIYACPKPVIARVQGDAFAGGVGLVAACDAAVGVATVRFCLSEVKLGLIPGTIAPYVVRAMGQRHAQRYALSAEVFNAEAAKSCGLLHETTADLAELDAQIAAWCNNFAAASPQALGDCKRLLDAVGLAENTLALREETAKRIAQSRASDDGKAGVAAFLNKTPPPWVV